MRVSFSIKKSVFVKSVFLLLVGLVVVSVLGQSYFVNPGNPSYRVVPSPLGSFAIPANYPSHALQFIAVHYNSPAVSVDTDANGFIDNADYCRWSGMSALSNDSNSVAGFVPTNQVINKGCIVVDTGVNGDGFTGSNYLDLRISNTVKGSQVNGYPPFVSENICEDGDGCEYNVVRYVKNTGTVLTTLYSSRQYYFQLPRVLQTGALPVANWMEGSGGSGVSGNNGDSTKTAFVNWKTTAGTNLIDIFDDDPTVETVPDQWTYNDRTAANSFIITVCD